MLVYKYICQFLSALLNTPRRTDMSWKELSLSFGFQMLTMASWVNLFLLWAVVSSESCCRFSYLGVYLVCLSLNLTLTKTFYFLNSVVPDVRAGAHRCLFVLDKWKTVFYFCKHPSLLTLLSFSTSVHWEKEEKLGKKWKGRGSWWFKIDVNT